MGLRKLGDSAWIFMSGQNDARSHLDLVLLLVDLMSKHPCPQVTDIVPSFDSVAVHFDPDDGPAVIKHLTSLNPPTSNPDGHPHAKEVVIPVHYVDGPDLQHITKSTGLSKEEIIQLHSSATYTVAAIGFSPGFPYLIGLPEKLHMPRRSSPSPVEAGSVAIAGSQAGIYPNASQGGWHVLGKTNLQLFDPNRETPSLLHSGDRVKFEAVGPLPESLPLSQPSASTSNNIEVIEPGAMTSIQDLGRMGHQHIGVSPGGAIDPISARIANRLVGNTDDAAVLECTMTGPVLKFHQDAQIACVGWADERSGRVHAINAGETIDLKGRLLHLRGYIAVRGGIDVPKVLGSRSTDIRAKFGGFNGRMLQTGDSLPIGSDTLTTPSSCRITWPHAENGILEIRYLPGVQVRWFTDETKKQFNQSLYRISPVSDRTGTRMDGPKVEIEDKRDMVSQAVVAGSIQIPPNGQPIVLMAERQTIGGYPQIGHVISADLPKLARAWPGTRIHFIPVTIHEARQAWADLKRELGIARIGIQLHQSNS